MSSFESGIDEVKGPEAPLPFLEQELAEYLVDFSAGNGSIEQPYEPKGAVGLDEVVGDISVISVACSKEVHFTFNSAGVCIDQFGDVKPSLESSKNASADNHYVGLVKEEVERIKGKGFFQKKPDAVA